MKKLITKSIGFFINSTAGVFPKWNTEFSFNLFCKVQRVGISPKGQQFFDKGSTQNIIGEDYNAVLHTWGSGPKKVLFLHGWASNAQRWRPYVEQLDESEFTTYAIDAPGHGMATGKVLNLEMYRKSIVQSLEQIGPIDHLVCHSIGSLTASYLFLHNPNIAVRKFTIMGAPEGMNAIFTYYQDLLSLSTRAMKNLEIKVTEVLQIPHTELTLHNFFKRTKQPILVVHEQSDRVTPFLPIKESVEQAINASKEKSITSFYTNGQDHNLKGPETVQRIIEFIKE